VEGVTSVLRRSGVLVRVGQDSAEQIRRREVSRALRKVDLSPEVEAEAVERMSRSLVGRLLHGPISRVMARAEVEISSGDRRSMEAISGLKRHGGGVESRGTSPPRREVL
jgi:glutamyl-tRNA reductase